MTAEYVLKAAIASMITGHHTPHCYSAHVPGQGYINDGSRVDWRDEYLRQLERDAQRELECLQFSHAYAEPGYEQPRRGILFSNWNRFPSEVVDLLERMGYAVEWSDEWTTCEICDKAMRTQPDSHSWRPQFDPNADTILCTECRE